MSDAATASRSPLTEDQRRRVERATPVVERVVAQLLPSWGSLIAGAEMRSLGFAGLIDAAETFDPDLGVPFDLFAVHRVRGAILDAVRKEAGHRHNRSLAARAASSRWLEVQAHGGNVLEDTEDQCRQRLEAFSDGLAASMFAAIATQSERSRSVEEDLAERQARHRALSALSEASDGLPEREQRILELHYRQDLDLKDVAKALGVGYATLRRWHVALLGRLSVRLRSRGVTEAPV